MNWNEAMEAMREGHAVRRASEKRQKTIDPGDAEAGGMAGAAIVESGQEGCRLMHAWTADEKPAMIFMGSMSKCLFVPDDEHRGATDWEIER
jgi:hypothetical protein